MKYQLICQRKKAILLYDTGLKRFRTVRLFFESLRPLNHLQFSIKYKISRTTLQAGTSTLTFIIFTAILRVRVQFVTRSCTVQLRINLLYFTELGKENKITFMLYVCGKNSIPLLKIPITFLNKVTLTHKRFTAFTEDSVYERKYPSVQK